VRAAGNKRPRRMIRLSDNPRCRRLLSDCPDLVRRPFFASADLNSFPVRIRGGQASDFAGLWTPDRDRHACYHVCTSPSVEAAKGRNTRHARVHENDSYEEPEAPPVMFGLRAIIELPSKIAG
jgi:hypothetical protein